MILQQSSLIASTVQLASRKTYQELTDKGETGHNWTWSVKRNVLYCSMMCSQLKQISLKAVRQLCVNVFFALCVFKKIKRFKGSAL